MNPDGLQGVEGIEAIFALIVRSAELVAEERWPDALACLDEAVAINPRLPLCQVNRARVLAALGRYAEALDDCDFFLDYATRLPEVVALRQQIFDEARQGLERRLARSPDDIAALFERGVLFMKSRLHAQALADFSAALARDPSHVDALDNQGQVLFAQNRYAEAIAAHRLATAGAPRRARLWFNLGTVWQAQGGFDEARAAYRQAIALDPGLAEAHLEIAHCDLAQGDYRCGWPRFEWRWQTAQMRGLGLASGAALWLGDRRAASAPDGGKGVDDLAGKTLLVWAEQGAGDTLQFVRFVPQLLARAGRVVLRVPAHLRRLVERLDPRLAVVDDDQATPPHDLHCPLMSLPLALGIGAPPSGAPYLSADTGDLAAWRRRLGGRQALRVGLAWAGRQHGLANSTRDVPLALLAPLAIAGCELISLQKDEAPAGAGLPGLRSFAESLGDYAQTAALIMNLDLVIAVDTSVAHLAGALGKPCWLLLRHSGEWRWQRERSDTPWYSSVRIFRQNAPGDWAELVARVSAELAQRLAQDQVGTP